MVDQRKRLVGDDFFELVFDHTGTGDVYRSRLGRNSNDNALIDVVEVND